MFSRKKQTDALAFYTQVADLISYQVFVFTSIGDVNPEYGIVGVNGTTLPISVWNTWPFLPNHLPQYVPPLPWNDLQLEAITALESFLEPYPDALAAFHQHWPTSPQEATVLEDFWQLSTTLPSFQSEIITPHSMSTRPIYSIRTHEMEQNGRLAVIAYAKPGDIDRYHLGIIQKHNVEFVGTSCLSAIIHQHRVTKLLFYSALDMQ